MDNDQLADGRTPLWRALQALSRGDGVLRKSLIEDLSPETGELKELQKYWKIDLRADPTVVRDAVLSRLDDYLDKIEPRRARQGLASEDRKEQYFNAVRVSFHMWTHPDLKGADLGGRRNWLARDARGKLKIAPSISQEDLNHAISQIERQILGVSYASLQVVEGLPAHPVSNVDPHYVPRVALNRQFANLMANGAKRILLVGQPGMGKTRAAQELPKDQAADREFLFLNAGLKDLSAEAVAAINRYAVDTSLLAAPTANGLLSVLLSSPSGPVFAVLDDVQSAADLTRLVPSSLHTTVLATCRNESGLPSGWHVLRVGRLTVDESHDMIRRALPTLADSDVADLATHLYGYPLVIRHVCTLLEQGVLSVADFIHQFIRNRRRYVSRTPADSAETALLVDVLKANLSCVRAKNEDAARLLECIGTIARLVGHGGLSHEYLSAFLSAAHGEVVQTPVPTIEYLAALRVLRQFGFIEREELGCITVHPLITDVLQLLAEPVFTETVTAIMHGYAQLLPPGVESSLGGWWKYQSYGEAATRRVGHVVAAKVAHLYIERVVARGVHLLGSQKWKHRAGGGQDFDGMLLGVSYMQAVAKEAVGNPRVAAQAGRLAYNLIEGRGTRLAFLLDEDTFLDAPPWPTWEELRERFANE